MPKRNDSLLLQDIKESIEKIRSYVEGYGIDDFLNDSKTKDAVSRNLEIIGEAANHLSIDFTLAHSGIEWRKVAAFRNRLIHEYFGADYKAVWHIIENNLTVLYDYIESAGF